MAGGVANIWGNLIGNPRINKGEAASRAYAQRQWIKTNADFFRGRFVLDLSPDNRLTNGVCLRRPDHSLLLFYREDCKSIRIDLSRAPRSVRAVAVDTKKTYAELDLGTLRAKNQSWAAPYESDWAIAVGRPAVAKGSRQSKSNRK